MKKFLAQWSVLIISVAIISILLVLTHSMFISSIGKDDSDENTQIIQNIEDTSEEDTLELVNEDEYSFLFFSLLYTQYPEIRSQDPNDIFEYICKTESSQEDYRSIYEEITEKTHSLLVQILSYNSDMENKGIEIDVSGQMGDYFNKKRAEALSSGLEFNEYLKSYYGTNETVSIRRIAEKYLAFIEYKNNYIPKQAEKELTDDYYSQEYDKSPAQYNLYSVSMLIYKYPSFYDDENMKSMLEELSALYDKVHSHDDMEQLSQEFEAAHPYIDSEQSPYGTICSIDTALTYSDISMLSPSIADYIFDPELAADTAALFEIDNGLLLLYYNGSQINDSPTYNGYILDSSDSRSYFYNSSLKELLIFTPPSLIYPQSFYIGDDEIVLEKEGLPYWKRIILNNYILDIYASIDNKYDSYSAHLLYLSGI